MARRTRKKPSAKVLADLGLETDQDGLCPVVMLTGASGDGFALNAGDKHRCDPSLAVGWVRKRIARPKAPKPAPEQPADPAA